MEKKRRHGAKTPVPPSRRARFVPFSERGEIGGRVAELFLDPEELVVLGHPVGAGGGAGLDLARAGGHGDVGDGRVLGLAGAVGDDVPVAGPLGHLDHVEGFGQRADLVDLDQDGVGHALLDALGQPLRVGHEEVVAHELDPLAQPLGQEPPALPVVLGHAVLDRQDGVLVDQFLVEVDHLGRALLGVGFGLEIIGAVLVELVRRGVDAEADLLAGLVARPLDGGEDEGEGLSVGLEVGGEPALVADGGLVALLLQNGLEVMEDLAAHADGLGDAAGAHGQDHALLEVEVVVGVGPAVEDVHHRDGEPGAENAAKVLVEGKTHVFRRGPGAGHGDAEDGVSMACARAAAEDMGLPLYQYLGGILGTRLPSR